MRDWSGCGLARRPVSDPAQSSANRIHNACTRGRCKSLLWARLLAVVLRLPLHMARRPGCHHLGGPPASVGLTVVVVVVASHHPARPRDRVALGYP